jgi:hypothetical protein
MFDRVPRAALTVDVQPCESCSFVSIPSVLPIWSAGYSAARVMVNALLEPSYIPFLCEKMRVRHPDATFRLQYSRLTGGREHRTQLVPCADHDR